MRNKLISYALEFASFLIERGIVPRKIILYGSVVSGESDRESDIDIFIDMDQSQERKIRDILKIFEKLFGEKWKLKGIENSFSLIIGDINSKKWQELKRSIQSNGILLYGSYNDFPENMNSYLIFNLDFSSIKRKEKVNLWRKLYGYTQKIGDKKYVKKGIIFELNGKKLEKSIVIIPALNAIKLREFFNENHIGFSVREIWSESL